jgi:hypothetical protein
MKPVLKVAIVAGGYLLAFLMAAAAVALHAEQSKESLTINRDDFWATTSNKQLNFPVAGSRSRARNGSLATS